MAAGDGPVPEIRDGIAGKDCGKRCGDAATDDHAEDDVAGDANSGEMEYVDVLNEDGDFYSGSGEAVDDDAGEENL